MKYKKYTQKSDGALLIRATLDKKKDEFNYVLAKLLKISRTNGLLPFSFEEEDVIPQLYFDISSCITLKEMLKVKISLDQYKSILKGLAVLLQDLQDKAMPEKNLVLDAEYVFVNSENMSLNFIYLPLNSQKPKDRALLDLALYISQNAQFVDDDASVFCRQFVDFIKSQRIFSLVELQAFVDSNMDFNELQKLECCSQNAHTDSFVQDTVFDLSKVKLVRLCDSEAWLISKEQSVLGRSKTADIQVGDHTAISRMHAVIVKKNGVLWILDKNSSNGTFVNGRLLSQGVQQSLRQGDIVTLGDQDFKIC